VPTRAHQQPAGVGEALVVVLQRRRQVAQIGKRRLCAAERFLRRGEAVSGRPVFPRKRGWRVIQSKTDETLVLVMAVSRLLKGAGRRSRAGSGAGSWRAGCSRDLDA